MPPAHRPCSAHLLSACLSLISVSSCNKVQLIVSSLEATCPAQSHCAPLQDIRLFQVCDYFLAGPLPIGHQGLFPRHHAYRVHAS